MSEHNYLSSSEFDAVFANCRRYWLNYGREIKRDGDVTLYRSGVDHSQLNGVMRIVGEDIDALVQESLHSLAGIPSLWWIGADSHPAALDEVARHGGKLARKVPVYAIRLNELPTAPIPDEISIEEVTTESEVLKWIECYAPSMGVAASEIGKLEQIEDNFEGRARFYRRFAAKVGGRMVGTSAFLESDGVAGIYLCSTAPEFRRKGIATLLTLRAAQAGLDQGLSLATLQASSSGEPVYQRLGFRKVADYDVMRF